jgi:23S rRNA pseudouridine1911/1915/1917 synthase
MSHIGHPLLGDRTYGYKPSRIKDETLRELIEEMGMHALCAYYLGFKHPSTGEWMEFEIPLPEGMKKIIDYLSEKN